MVLSSVNLVSTEASVGDVCKSLAVLEFHALLKQQSFTDSI